MLTLIFVGFFYTPYDPNAMEPGAKFAGISARHLMGCDNFGRDVFSRVLQGSRNTLYVAFFTVLIGTGFGDVVGAVNGYYGGILDEILMRLNDAVFAFPSLLLALVFIGILGPGRNNVIAALGIAFIPSFARIVRGEFLKYRNMTIESARLQGAGDKNNVCQFCPTRFRCFFGNFNWLNNAVLAEGE